MLLALKIDKDKVVYVAERCNEPVAKIKRFVNQYIIVGSSTTGLNAICYVDDEFFDEHFVRKDVFNGHFQEIQSD